MLPWPLPMMRVYDYNPESRLHCYQAAMAIDDQWDGQVVDGATNFQKEGDSSVSPAKSYSKVTSPLGGRLPRHASRSRPSSRPSSLPSRPRFYLSRLSKQQTWGRPDGHWHVVWITSQCRLPMTTSCKIYSPKHAEALHRAQTAPACLNLVSITILEKLTC